MDADEERSYRDDLCELVQNKKPLITMLSQGADVTLLDVLHHMPLRTRLYIYCTCSSAWDMKHPHETVAEEYLNEPGAAQIVELIHTRLKEVGLSRNFHVLKFLCHVVNIRKRIKVNISDFFLYPAFKNAKKKRIFWESNLPSLFSRDTIRDVMWPLVVKLNWQCRAKHG